jgi:hypothetical protein
MNNISQKSTFQLFYPTLAAEWKGLSRVGLDIFAHLGVTLTSRQYTLMKRELARTEKEKTIQMTRDRNGVLWCDNFSHIYENAYYHISTGICTNTVLFTMPSPPPFSVPQSLSQIYLISF